MGRAGDEFDGGGDVEVVGRGGRDEFGPILAVVGFEGEERWS